MSEEESAKPTRLAGMAAVLCAMPLLGLLISVWGVVRAMEKWTNENGVTDAAALRQAVGQALFPTAVGLLLAAVGLPLALWCIVKRSHRPWWLVTAASFAGFLLAWVVVHGAWIFLSRPASAL